MFPAPEPTTARASVHLRRQVATDDGTPTSAVSKARSSRDDPGSDEAERSHLAGEQSVTSNEGEFRLHGTNTASNTAHRAAGRLEWC